MYLSKKSDKNYEKSSDYKTNAKILKGTALITLFIVLICGRCFTLVTTDKIYYSSFDTLFLTKSYDYSEIKAIDIVSYKYGRTSHSFEYNITFGNHNVNLLNSLEIDKDNKVNKVHRNIIKKSKDVIMHENLKYKTEKILTSVSIITDLY